MRMRNHHHHHRQHGPSLFSSLGQALNFNFHHSSRDELYSAAAAAAKADPRAANFDLKLVERLSTLELALAPTKQSFSLAWIDQALVSVTSIVSETLSIIPGIVCPLTERDEQWVSKYLEDTCRFLDVLNTLRKVVGDLEHRLMLLHLVVSTLESKHGTKQERYARARKALQEFACPDGPSTACDTVKSCCVVLREMLEQRPGFEKDLLQQQQQHKAQSFLSGLYAAKVVAVVVLGMIVSLFSSGNAPVGIADWPIPVNFAWSQTLRALLLRLRNSLQVKGTTFSPLLDEFVGLELEMKCLEEKLQGVSDLGEPEEKPDEEPKVEKEVTGCENGSESCRNVEDEARKLGTVLKSVEERLDRVRQDMDKLFHVIVGNRNSLLSCLRGSVS